jgi:hypothetical protein
MPETAKLTKGDIALRDKARIKLESRTHAADFGEFFRAAWEVMEPELLWSGAGTTSTSASGSLTLPPAN